MHEEILKKIGLTGNEAKIYEFLIKHKSCLVSSIVKGTKLNRTHTYDRLKKLVDKGMVSYAVKSGRKYFKALSPDKLLQVIEEEEEQILNKKKDFLKILPKLKKTIEEEEISIEVLEGKEGLKTLLQDILKEKKEVLILNFTGAVANQIKYSYPYYQRKRIKLKIRRKVLIGSGIKDKELLKQPFTESKYLPRKYKSPSGMWLYGEKAVIFLPGEELYMIFIKSKKIIKQYKNYFEIIWKTSKVK